MSGRHHHLIDPELAARLAQMPQIDLALHTLPAMRIALERMTPDVPLPAGISLHQSSVPARADAPAVPLLIHMPSERRSAGAILHFHGGGMVMGSPSISGPRNAWLAAKLGCPVVSVDYRLAPETPAPGNAEDGVAALIWLREQSAAVGIDPARVALLGESAGGLMAVATALLARDRGVMPASGLALVYPMLDDRTTRDAAPNACGEEVWTAANNLFAWNCLLGGRAGEADTSAYAAPARASSLAGLPPTFLAVGALDLFVEEDLAFVARLAREGVTVESHVYPGAYHGFDMQVDAAVSQRFLKDLTASIEKMVS